MSFLLKGLTLCFQAPPYVAVAAVDHAIAVTVWPGAILGKNDADVSPTTLTLGYGDVLLMRADLVHTVPDVATIVSFATGDYPCGVCNLPQEPAAKRPSYRRDSKPPERITALPPKTLPSDGSPQRRVQSSPEPWTTPACQTRRASHRSQRQTQPQRSAVGPISFLSFRRWD